MNAFKDLMSLLGIWYPKPASAPSTDIIPVNTTHESIRCTVRTRLVTARNTATNSREEVRNQVKVVRVELHDRD